MPTRKPWYRRWWHVMVKTVRGVIRMEDTPYRVAMGCACGLFSSVLPIFGQMVVGMILSRLCRANVVASMPWTWLSNPATTFPIWYGCYVVGAAVMGEQPVTIATVQALASRVEHDGMMATLSAGGAMMTQLVVPLILGTLLVGLALGAVGYLVVKPVVIRIQARRAAKIARWGAVVHAQQQQAAQQQERAKTPATAIQPA